MNKKTAIIIASAIAIASVFFYFYSQQTPRFAPKDFETASAKLTAPGASMITPEEEAKYLKLLSAPAPASVKK